MKSSKKIFAVMLILIFAIGLIGCEHPKEDTKTKGQKIGDGVGEIIDGLLGD